MTQLAFDLPRRTAFGRSDFLVSDSNITAVDRIDRWPDWPSAVLVLHGPPGCGKTHLVHLWRDRSSAAIITGESLTDEMLPRLIHEVPRRIAVDDAERASEQALLHLYNSCIEHQGSLLITTCRPPGLWQVVLADLRSRLRAAPTAEIGAPDDVLLSAVLVKHFADHQLHVVPEVIKYLLRRIDRSFAAAGKIVDRLDNAALSSRGPVTIPLARRVLGQCGRQPLPPRSGSTVT
jgi:chromosomal replication initiation ATPase DnaA